MGRRIDSPRPEPDGAVSDEYRAWRCTQLARFLMASEPDSPAAATSARIRAEAARVHDAPPADRLAALEALLAELGLTEAADRHVEHLLANRRRWLGGGDFAPGSSAQPREAR